MSSFLSAKRVSEAVAIHDFYKGSRTGVLPLLSQSFADFKVEGKMRFDPWEGILFPYISVRTRLFVCPLRECLFSRRRDFAKGGIDRFEYWFHHFRELLQFPCCEGTHGTTDDDTCLIFCTRIRSAL